MANSTLAVKYRPRTLNSVRGQESIKVILKEQIRTGNISHANLFCGMAGCGKTTVARIFAEEINCEEGYAIEIDAASNTGVDNIRSIIESAGKKALSSKYKVYLIDECHMLSTGAWNAMLKLLEEPPMGAIFILCTTDPQKIPDTILSRVQRFDFSRLPLEDIIFQLSYIYEVEYGCEPLEEPINYIAKMADGGMRDAITLLEKALSYSEELTMESVLKALGGVDYSKYFSLMQHLRNRRTKESLQIIEEIYNDGKDIKPFMKEFQAFIVDVCKYQLFGSFEYTKIPEDFHSTLGLYLLKDADVMPVLEFAFDANSTIKWEANAKSMLEMLIILFCKETDE